MQALWIGELRAGLRLRSGSHARTHRGRETLRVVRFVQLRTWLRLRAEQDSSTWAWRQQVHLVRLYFHRRGVQLLAD